MKKLFVALIIAMLSNASAADSREIIELSAEQRDALLSEMRALLVSSQQVLEGVVTNDLEQVEVSARAMGINNIKGAPPSFAKQLPAGFKKLGPQVHKAFERIANEADGFGDTQKILTELSDMQKVCTTCHATYQIQVKQ